MEIHGSATICGGKSKKRAEQGAWQVAAQRQRLRGSQGLHSTQRAVEKGRNSKKAAEKTCARSRERIQFQFQPPSPLPLFVPFHPIWPFPAPCVLLPPSRFPSAPGSCGIGAAGPTEEAGQGIGGSPHRRPADVGSRAPPASLDQYVISWFLHFVGSFIMIDDSSSSSFYRVSWPIVLSTKKKVYFFC